MDERRAYERAKYARNYPEGFKRRRNTEQTRAQRVAQRRYDRIRGGTRMRRLQAQVRNFLSGTSNAARELVGCTREELIVYLQPPPNVLKWHLSYKVHPREFDLETQAEECFHYTNLMAKPVKLAPSQSPLQPALSLKD